MAEFFPYRKDLRHPAWQEVAAFTGSRFRPEWCHGNDAKIHEEFSHYPDAATFYRETDVYLYHGPAFFMEGIKRPYYAVLFRLLANLDASILDYGGGCGDDALLFASLGFNVTLADIPSRSLQFAKWRCQRRGQSISIFEIGKDDDNTLRDVDDDRFMIVWCCDVLEHLLPSEHRGLIDTLCKLGQTVFLVLVNDPEADGRVHYPVDLDGLTQYAGTKESVWACNFYQGRTRLLIIGGLASIMNPNL